MLFGANSFKSNLIGEQIKRYLIRNRKKLGDEWLGRWLDYLDFLSWWLGRWLGRKKEVSAIQLSDLYKIMILFRKNMVAGAGFEPATFGL